jgi:formate-dependent nitrite reductase membrane component NrfD
MKILRRVAAGTVLAVVTLFALFMVSPASVYADEAAPVVTEDVGSRFVITSPVWTVLTGILLPIVVGLVTKASASNRFQAIVGIVVAAVGALVLRATTVDGAGVLDKALVLDIALVYIPQIASYLGVWKQFALNEKTAPNAGLG